MDIVKNFVPTGAASRAKGMIDEFKKFAFKGNVVDLAVGVIIGAAFGKIVNSLVQDVIMPLVGVLLPGDQGYSGWILKVSGKEVPYGKFLGEVVNFLIVALALFFFVRFFLGAVLRTKQEEATAPPPPTKDQELLIEIRDLLARQT